MLLCALLGALLVGGPFVIVTMHVRMAQEQYHLSDLRTKIERAERENRDETAHVASMMSGDWIVREAQRLGLVQPRNVTVITIDSDHVTASSPDTATKQANSRSIGEATVQDNSSHANPTRAHNDLKDAGATTP